MEATAREAIRLQNHTNELQRLARSPVQGMLDSVAQNQALYRDMARSPLQDAIKAFSENQTLIHEMTRTPLQDAIKAMSADRRLYDELTKSPVQSMLQDFAKQNAALRDSMNSPLQQAAREFLKPRWDTSAARDFARLSLNTDTAKLYSGLQGQNAAILKDIGGIGRVSEAARQALALPYPEAAAAVRRDLGEKQRALDGVKARVSTSSAQAQALIKAVEELPDGAEKEAIAPAAQEEVALIAGVEILVPLLQEGLDRQEAAAAREIRQGELTAHLVAASEALVKSSEALLATTREGNTEALRRDNANKDLSERLKLIAYITLFVAVVGVLRDFGLFGRDPIQVNVVVPSAVPTPVVTPLFTAPATPPPATPPLTPRPTPRPTPTPETRPTQPPATTVPASAKSSGRGTN